ncbi:MAG: hypothetical protein IIV97_06015, partial [Oscillospiraceae bacterium]|nr:hypothetical protein [Oscillospiraceae bacterium]
MKKEKTAAYNGDFQALEIRIKEALRSVLPEEVYNTWVDNFVFERIDSSAIVVAYYGREPLRGFKKHRQAVWLHICSIAGYSKKLKIRKKKAKAKVGLTPRARKHIRVANLLVLSAFFVAIAAAFAVVMCSYVVNRNF